MAIGNEDKRVTINDRGRKQEECTGNLVFVFIFSLKTEMETGMVFYIVFFGIIQYF